MNVNVQDPFLVVAGIVLCLGGVACQPETPRQAEEDAAVDTAAIRADIDSVRSGFEEAFNSRNFETTKAFVHPEIIYSPPGSPPIRGRDTVIALYRSAVPSRATIKIDPIDTQVLSNKWVYDYGISTVTYTPEGTDTEQSVKSTYLVIYRQTDDGWTIYRESLSSNTPVSGGS